MLTLIVEYFESFWHSDSIFQFGVSHSRWSVHEPQQMQHQDLWQIPHLRVLLNSHFSMAVVAVVPLYRLAF